MRMPVPINIIVYPPETETGKLELAGRVASIHADAVTNRIKELNCPKQQKLALLESVIDTAKANNAPGTTA